MQLPFLSTDSLWRSLKLAQKQSLIKLKQLIDLRQFVDFEQFMDSEQSMAKQSCPSHEGDCYIMYTYM